MSKKLMRNLSILLIALSALGLCFIAYTKNVESKNQSYQTNFLESEDFYSKREYYQKVEALYSPIVMGSSKNLLDNNIKLMKEFFKNYYDSNIQVNDIDLENFNGTDQERSDSAKSAYENLLNLESLLDEEAALSESMIKNFKNDIEDAKKHIEPYLN